MTVALVDTGIDYTHADFGGPGTERAYNRNDPNFVEPGSFPTAKVIGGFDFVGSNYDPLRQQPVQRRPAAGLRSPRPRRSRDAHRRDVLRHRRPRHDRSGCRPQGEAARLQGLGRRRLDGRRAGRRVRTRRRSGPGRRHQRPGRRALVLGRRRLRHAELRRGGRRTAGRRPRHRVRGVRRERRQPGRRWLRVHRRAHRRPHAA